MLGMNEKKYGKNFAVTFICAKFAADLGTTPRNQFQTRNGFFIEERFPRGVDGAHGLGFAPI